MMREEERDCMGNGLFFELIPKSLMGKAPRKIMPASEWKAVSAYVKERAGLRCEICGGRGRLQAHERYGICGDALVLLRIMALCGPCHLASHIGYAHVLGKGREALARYARLNGFSADQALTHLDGAMDRWQSLDGVAHLDWSIIASPPYMRLVSGKTAQKALASFRACGGADLCRCECMRPLAYAEEENVQVFPYQGQGWDGVPGRGERGTGKA